MKFDIVSIFPDFFRGPLDYGIVRRAREAEIIEIKVHDLRAFTHDRHRTVDDRPFGGGEGMVLKPEPVWDCVEPLAYASREDRVAGRAKESIVVLSAGGRPLTQQVAHELAQLDRVLLLCGRYEGVDERVTEYLADREISVGDFVLSGGEPAALAIVDATVRLLPGAMSDHASAFGDSFWERGLSAPSYTRPPEYRGHVVPEVLLSGDHGKIARWRFLEGERLTRERDRRETGDDESPDV